MPISMDQGRNKNVKKDEFSRTIGVWQLIRGDVKRYKNIGEAITKLGFYATLFYRVSHCLYKRGLTWLARFVQLLSHIITGTEISHRAVIGPGLGLLHPTAVMIGPRVQIGKAATICQSVTISSNHLNGDEGPTIGDHFWAGPGCVVMGPIFLGEGVWVGPNAVLLRSVQSYMNVQGNPARVFPREAFQRSSSKLAL